MFYYLYLFLSILFFIYNTGVKIYAELYAWVAVFMLPINSAINPVLYTLTTKLFKQQLARIVYTWRAGGIPVATPPGSSGISMSSTPFNGKNSKNSVNITTSDVRKVVYHLRTLSPLKLMHTYAFQSLSLFNWKSSDETGSRHSVPQTWQSFSTFRWFENSKYNSMSSDKELIKGRDLSLVPLNSSKNQNFRTLQYQPVDDDIVKQVTTTL